MPRVIAAFLLTAWSGNVLAASISLEPAGSVAAPGSIVSLELVISGLGDGVAPSLGDYDIDIGFDSAALTFSGYTLSDSLGDVGLGEALDVSFGLFAAGGINVAQVSFLTDAELDALQGDTFVLATLDFTLSALAPGDTTLVDILGVFAPGDTLGMAIPVDAVAGATITAVPLPAGLWLLATALLALVGSRKRP